MRGYRQWNSQPSETKGFLSDLKKRVGGYLEEGSVLVKPMGVGGCVDHRILADVKFDVPLQLGYEDLPYADYPELGFPKGFERVHRIDVTKKIGEKLTRLREYGSQLSESDLERVRHHSEFNGRNYEKLWRQE
jgi:hypothetical protein